MRRRILAAALLIVLTVCASQDLGAHPLGNFSISQYSAIGIDRNKIELRYLIDMAEIPTFQELQNPELLRKREMLVCRPILRLRPALWRKPCYWKSTAGAWS